MRRQQEMAKELARVRADHAKDHEALKRAQSIIDGESRGPPREPRGTTRVAIPKFSGDKGSTDAITWLGQFGRYANLLRLKPEELVSHATLCLEGRAAREWAFMEKALTAQNKDIENFDVFKEALTTHFVDPDVESTVRVRLARLKQSGSVAQYHSTFRGILVEAVTNPVLGAEAVSLFKQGLKAPILEQLMKDSVTRHEHADLEKVVQAAKEAEQLIGVLAGLVRAGKGEGPLPGTTSNKGAKRPNPDPAVHPPQGKQHKGNKATNRNSTPDAWKVPRQESKGGSKYTPEEKAAHRAAATCGECGGTGHYTNQCANNKTAKPSAPHKGNKPKPK
jgi:hypothetical protein